MIEMEERRHWDGSPRRGIRDLLPFVVEPRNCRYKFVQDDGKAWCAEQGLVLHRDGEPVTDRTYYVRETYAGGAFLFHSRDWAIQFRLAN